MFEVRRRASEGGFGKGTGAVGVGLPCDWTECGIDDEKDESPPWEGGWLEGIVTETTMGLARLEW